MDRENGKSSDNGSNSSKLSNQTDPAALLDAASLFGGTYGYCNFRIIKWSIAFNSAISISNNMYMLVFHKFYILLCFFTLKKKLFRVLRLC